MKVKKATKIFIILKRLFRIREWSDFDRIKAATQFVIAAFKQVFIPQEKKLKKNALQKKIQEDSFQKAVEKMHLAQGDLYEKQTSLYRLSLLMSVTALGLFSYAIYQLLYGSYRAVMVSLVLTLLALTLAFRYHFWYFQIREKRLGCSLREWYDSLRSTRGKK